MISKELQKGGLNCSLLLLQAASKLRDLFFVFCFKHSNFCYRLEICICSLTVFTVNLLSCFVLILSVSINNLSFLVTASLSLSAFESQGILSSACSFPHHLA